MDAKSNYFSWLVAYIEKDHISKCKEQILRNPEYLEVEAFIPTIKVLRKQFKGKNYFDEVPLLFNYGFFKVPRKYAVYKNFLDDMQKNISCIYAWVKDPQKVIRTYEGGKYFEDNISVACATSEEISKLIKNSIHLGAHSAEDIGLLKEGQLITLQGYPWEGMSAEFVRADPKRKKVKVRIILFDSVKEMEVSFDNVYFTMYHKNNWDDTIGIGKSLDEMGENKTLDKFTDKIQGRHENE